MKFVTALVCMNMYVRVVGWFGRLWRHVYDVSCLLYVLRAEAGLNHELYTHPRIGGQYCDVMFSS